MIRILEDTIFQLEAENKIMREALDAIIKHQKAMGPIVYEYSVTAIIAKDAIIKIDKV